MPGLADGATAPRQAATATAAAAATAATSAAASAASATSAAAAASAATSGHLFTERRPEILLVEDIERAEADIGDLFLGEGEPRARRGILGRQVGHRTGGCRRCAARQRQRHANDSQRRHNFLPTLSLRSLRRHCHSRSSMNTSTYVRGRRPKQQGRLCKGTLQGRAACRNAPPVRRVPTARTAISMQQQIS